MFVVYGSGGLGGLSDPINCPTTKHGHAAVHVMPAVGAEKWAGKVDPVVNLRGEQLAPCVVVAVYIPLDPDVVGRLEVEGLNGCNPVIPGPMPMVLRVRLVHRQPVGGDGRLLYPQGHVVGTDGDELCPAVGGDAGKLGAAIRESSGVSKDNLEPGHDDEATSTLTTGMNTVGLWVTYCLSTVQTPPALVTLAMQTAALSVEGV